MPSDEREDHRQHGHGGLCQCDPDQERRDDGDHAGRRRAGREASAERGAADVPARRRRRRDRRPACSGPGSGHPAPERRRRRSHGRCRWPRRGRAASGRARNCPRRTARSRPPADLAMEILALSTSTAVISVSRTRRVMSPTRKTSRPAPPSTATGRAGDRHAAVHGGQHHRDRDREPEREEHERDRDADGGEDDRLHPQHGRAPPALNRLFIRHGQIMPHADY